MDFLWTTSFSLTQPEAREQGSWAMPPVEVSLPEQRAGQKSHKWIQEGGSRQTIACTGLCVCCFFLSGQLRVINSTFGFYWNPNSSVKFLLCLGCIFLRNDKNINILIAPSLFSVFLQGLIECLFSPGFLKSFYFYGINDVSLHLYNRFLLTSLLSIQHWQVPLAKGKHAINISHFYFYLAMHIWWNKGRFWG